MRRLLVLAYLANLILALVAYVLLPAQVAIHFAWRGAADGWTSRLASTLLVMGLDTLTFLSLWLSPAALRRLPAKWINLPHRAYWLSPVQREPTIARLSERLWAFGAALFLFLLVVGLLTLEANLADPVRLDERLFLVALAVFLLYTLYWTLALVRAFRPPKDPHA